MESTNKEKTKILTDEKILSLSIHDKLKQQKTYVADRLADKFMPVNGLLGFGS